MGYALRIPRVKFGRDNGDILVNGSLILIEPGAVGNSWQGIPSNGALIPNLAASMASPLVGGDASQLVFENTMTTSNGIVERSARGGLHVAEKWGGGATGARVRINLPSASPVRSYLDANQGHTLYMACWGRFTRAADPSLGTILHSRLTGSSGTRLGVGVLPSSAALVGNPGSSDSRRLGFLADPSAGNAYQSIAAASVPAGFATPHQQTVFLAGPDGSAQVNKSPGFLLWWLYVEDLSVSGRSFAQVDELVHRYYEQQVLTDGGRYFGDAYTAPV